VYGLWEKVLLRWKKMKDRITIRRNEVEKAELDLFMKSFSLDNESESYKMAVRWVNEYIKNVTKTFFPSNYDLILSRKRKYYIPTRKIYDEPIMQ